MLRDAQGASHQPEQVVREIHRFYGTQPQARDVRFRQQQPDHPCKPHRAARFASPPAEIDSAEYHFAIPRGEVTYLLDYLPHGSAPAASAHKRDNAKRAAVIAAVLYFEVGAGPVSRSVLHRGGEKIVLREDIPHVDAFANVDA